MMILIYSSSTIIIAMIINGYRVISVFTSSLMKTPSGLLAIILQIRLPIHQALAYFLHLICLLSIYFRTEFDYYFDYPFKIK